MRFYQDKAGKAALQASSSPAGTSGPAYSSRKAMWLLLALVLALLAGAAASTLGALPLALRCGATSSGSGGDKDRDNKPVIVAVCGGSGSGKTTLMTLLRERLGEEHVTCISHDHYYKNFNHLSLDERAQINFDSPDSLDSALLVEHLAQLKRGRPVRVPVYDFASHSRKRETTLAQPRKIILVDGILIFAIPALLESFDVKIYVSGSPPGSLHLQPPTPPLSSPPLQSSALLSRPPP